MAISREYKIQLIISLLFIFVIALIIISLPYLNKELRISPIATVTGELIASYPERAECAGFMELYQEQNLGAMLVKIDKAVKAGCLGFRDVADLSNSLTSGKYFTILLLESFAMNEVGKSGLPLDRKKKIINQLKHFCNNINNTSQEGLDGIQALLGTWQQKNTGERLFCKKQQFSSPQIEAVMYMIGVTSSSVGINQNIEDFPNIPALVSEKLKQCDK